MTLVSIPERNHHLMPDRTPTTSGSSRRRGLALRAGAVLAAALPTLPLTAALPAVALPAALIAPAVLAEPASAGTYRWNICLGGNPVGSAAANDRVTNLSAGKDTGYGAPYATPCLHNNSNNETSVKADQLTASTHIAAPPDTRLTTLRLNTVGNNYSWNGAWGYLFNSENRYFRCNFYDNDIPGNCDGRGAGGFSTQIERVLELGAAGSNNVHYGIYCRGQGGCGLGTLDLVTNYLAVDVRDERGPGLDVGGPAWASSSLNGTPTLNYSVRDNAAGGKGVRVLIDGDEKANTQAADNGGCTDNNWHHCPDDVDRAVGVSLAGVPDGQRTLTVIGYDDLDNASTPRTRSVLVDNQPPAMSGETTLTGKAQQGEQLTCVAPTISGQNPTVAYSWTRYNADGTGATPIAGQIETRYTQTSQDIAKKISCTVRATDGGGTSTSTSSLTAGPFANGATVAPGTGPTPTGTTTLTSSGGNVSQPRMGETLTMKAPDYPSGSAKAYSWLRCDGAGQNCLPISGATEISYTLVEADKDRRIVGQVVATDASGSSTSRSEPTGLVTATPQGGSTVTPDRTDAAPGATGAGGAAGAGGAPGGAVTTVVLTDGERNGDNACREARLTARFVSGTTTTVGFGKPATLTGRLTCITNGRGVAGASIALTARQLGTTAFRPAGVIVTAKDGTFTRKLAKGSGRQLALVYTAIGGDAVPAATTNATMRVRGKIVLQRVSRLAKRGGSIVFRGRLHGGGIPKGFRLLLQAQNGRKWQLLAPVRVKSNGAFRFTYRCACQQPGARFRFRMMIPSATRLPYVATVSRAHAVRVR